MTDSRIELYEETRPQVRAVSPVKKYDADAVMDAVLTAGDLDRLSPKQRSEYYLAVCESMGLNPLTKPFDLIKLNGKLVMYATKNATDQLRKLAGVSITSIEQKIEDGLIIVTANVRDHHGRTDSDIGAVTLGNLQGEAKANAVMKALTKAKRRATLSICGLGMLDESEVGTIPGAEIIPMDIQTGEIRSTTATITEAEPAMTTDDDHQRALRRLHAVAAEEGVDRDDVKQFIADLKRIPVGDVPSRRDWSLPFIGWATTKLQLRGAEWVADRQRDDQTVDADVVEYGLEGTVRRPLTTGVIADDEPDEDEAAAMAFDLAMAQAERAEVAPSDPDRWTR